MDSEAKGQLGGIDTSPEIRTRLARESRAWRCNGCGWKTNDEIMRERQFEVDHLEVKEVKEEEVPGELHLGYRDELSKTKADASAPPVQNDVTSYVEARDTAVDENMTAIGTQSTPVDKINSTPHVTGPTNSSPGQTPDTRGRAQTVSSWLDLAIGGVAAALVVMVLRRLAYSM